jgi:hypothetical protein
VNVNQLDRLDRIVAEKSWASFDFLCHPEKTVHQSLVDMLASLASNEVDLSLDFLEDYLIVRDYGRHARDLMAKIKELSGDQDVLFTPILDYQATRPKSGHALHYDMAQFSGLFNSNNASFLDDPKSEECQRHEGIHVSVDDFIGTGNQFLRMRDAVVNDGLNFGVTHIATICIQAEAFQTLKSEGFSVVALYIREKAMDLASVRRQSASAPLYEEYDTMVRKTGCSKAYRLGRDDSEALVTMKRTPNNTLAVFWTKGKKSSWPAPFPRS